MQHFFNITYRIAQSIDEYMLNKHIGSYEALYFYHEQYVKKYKLTGYDGEIMIKVKKDLTAMNGLENWSKKYVEEMIKYYHEKI